MKKTLAAASISLLMMGGLTGVANAENFKDEGRFDAWYSGSAKNMYSRGIIKGYADGSFGGEKTVTRAELAVMLDRMIQMLEKMRNDNKGKDEEPVACTMEYRYGLTVYLQDEDGKPLSDAKISVDTREKDPGNFEGNDGVYMGLGEAKGYFTITIEKEGYSTHRETVKLEKDSCHVMPQVRTITLFR